MSPQKSKQDFGACSLVGEQNKDETFPMVEAEKSTPTMRNSKRIVCSCFCSSKMYGTTLVILITETGGATYLRRD